MKKMLKKVKTLPLALTALMIIMFPSSTFAATNPFKDSISTSSADALYTDLGKVINIITAVGGFWVLACIVFSGIMLAGSGSNPQKRSAGFVGLGCALLGAWIMMKAATIGGWVVSLG